MATAMRWAFWVFVALYILALALLVIGTFGLLGQERDPLSGIFLLPLGLPWNILADSIGIGGALSGVAAPAINAIILLFLSKRLTKS